MKKRDEGYVLAFVMVVIVVLCLVAVSLMSISLRNLEAQNDSIQRMEDKYAAMGEIEQVVAALSKSELERKISFTSSDNVKLQLEDYLKSLLGEENPVDVTAAVSGGGTDDTKTVFTAPLKIEVQSHSVQIVAEIAFSMETANNQITKSSIAYTSYQISTVATGEEGAE